MELVILLIVSAVILQTWLDWREAERRSLLPGWMSGLALAGVLAAGLTTTTSLAPVLRTSAAQSGDFGATLFWPIAGVALCLVALLVGTSRFRRLRRWLLLTGLLVAAFWLGITLAM